MNRYFYRNRTRFSTPPQPFRVHLAIVALLYLLLPRQHSAYGAPVTLDSLHKQEINRLMEILDTPAERYLIKAQAHVIESTPERKAASTPYPQSVTWLGTVKRKTDKGFVLELGERRIMVYGPAKFTPGTLIKVKGQLRYSRKGHLEGLILQSQHPLNENNRGRVYTPPPRTMSSRSGIQLASPRIPYMTTPISKLATWINRYNPNLPFATARRYAALIIAISQRRHLDPRLVTALVAAESAFNRKAVSRVGAQGLGQLMPSTAHALGVTDPYEPQQNLEATVRYLKLQLNRWNDVKLALAAYNAGPGAVSKYQGIPPYQETRNYVAYVLDLYKQLQKTIKEVPQHEKDGFSRPIDSTTGIYLREHDTSPTALYRPRVSSNPNGKTNPKGH